MLASVIIPVYHGAATLERTLKGFLAQQLGQKFELVLCDDGSTDGSPQILARYENHPQVKVIYQDNQGQSAATNRAAQNAQGELLIFSAQDIVPQDRHFLSRHLNWHRKFAGDRCLTGYIRYPEKLVTSDFMVFMRDGHHQFDYRHIPDPDDIDPMRLYAPNFSVKKSRFLGAGGFDESFRYGFQDTDLGIRFYSSGLKITLANNITCFHYHPLVFENYALNKRSFGRLFVDLYIKHQDFFEIHRQPGVILKERFVLCFKYLINRDLFERMYIDIKHCQDTEIDPLYELYYEFSEKVGKLPALSDNMVLFDNKYHSQKYWCKYIFYSSLLSFYYYQGILERAVELGLLNKTELDLTPII
ncbi:MAG: glycosyltransferase family 2 protein [Desulfobaccales bacterium]